MIKLIRIRKAIFVPNQSLNKQKEQRQSPGVMSLMPTVHFCSCSTSNSPSRILINDILILDFLLIVFYFPFVCIVSQIYFAFLR